MSSVPASDSGTGTTSRPLRFGILGTGRISSDFCHSLVAYQRQCDIESPSSSSSSTDSSSSPTSSYTLPSCICPISSESTSTSSPSTPPAVAAPVSSSLPSPFQLVACGSRSSSSALRFGGHFNLANEACHSSYEDLCRDTNVDVIYVGSPTGSHYEHTLLALNHNKHVLCEKSMSLSSEQSAKMIELARSRKLFLMEANWMAFWPLIKKTIALVEEGVLGEIRSVHADLGFQNNDEGNPGLLDPALGGGALLAVTYYPLSFSNLIFNKAPDRVVASADMERVDVSNGAVLSYGPRRSAVVSGSICANTHCMAMVTGTMGSVRLESPMFLCPTKMTLSLTDGDASERILSEEKERSPDTSVTRSDNGDLVFRSPAPNAHGLPFNFPNSSGLVYEALHVCRCIANGQTESAVWTHERTMGLFGVMDQMREQFPSAASE
eukprot:TRINITY_DN9134_c0_g1_i1.p1 TRINITY_DN9134_c0_g1~~TRINITY_DN9134_c0_g1_i1.p1  ORF type:complete len:447 (-),score=95.40 TRINITY_DN9134_c0_g1_i1:15-1325(-)